VRRTHIRIYTAAYVDGYHIFSEKKMLNCDSLNWNDGHRGVFSYTNSEARL